LRHLITAKEILGLRLATLHNLHFVLNLMRQIRQSIFDSTFTALKEEFLAGYEAGEDYRLEGGRGIRGDYRDPTSGR
jgi:queuine tRNA-ribosyltransferase